MLTHTIDAARLCGGV